MKKKLLHDYFPLPPNSMQDRGVSHFYIFVLFVFIFDVLVILSFLQCSFSLSKNQQRWQITSPTLSDEVITDSLPSNLSPPKFLESECYLKVWGLFRGGDMSRLKSLRLPDWMYKAQVHGPFALLLDSQMFRPALFCTIFLVFAFCATCIAHPTVKLSDSEGAIMPGLENKVTLRANVIAAHLAKKICYRT
jgi:hypothetical protein